MKPRSCLFIFLIVGTLTLMGGILGIVIGLALTEYLPPWRNVILGSAPEGAIDILFVVYRSTVDDFSQDSVYVKTLSDEVFEFDDGRWKMLSEDKIPLEEDEPIACATEWGKRRPPLGRKALDSAGVQIERPISTIARCYVLLDDGNLQVWTRATDAFTLMRVMGISTGVGISIGIVIGILVARATTRNRLTYSQ